MIVRDEIFVKDVCISEFNSGLEILRGFDKFEIKLMKVEFFRMKYDIDDSDIDEVLRLRERWEVLEYLEDMYGRDILVKGILLSGMCSSKYDDCLRWWKEFKKLMENKLVKYVIEKCEELMFCNMFRDFDKIVDEKSRLNKRWVRGN